MSKELGMTFRADMAEMIRKGLKTQTRRLIEPQPKSGAPVDISSWEPGIIAFKPGQYGVYREGTPVGRWGLESVIDCPWQVGDRIFVQEEWADTNGESGPMISYKAGGDRFLVEDSYPVDYSRYPGGHFTMWCGDLRRGAPDHEWCPAKEMPAWAARTWLEIMEIRAQRIQDISDVDAIAEGVPLTYPEEDESKEAGGRYFRPASHEFRQIWQSLYPGSWERNDWVWALTLKVLEEKGGVE